MTSSADYIRDNTQPAASVGHFLAKHLQPAGSSFSVVSAYFSIYAHAHLQRQLDEIGDLRFLFGEPNFVLDRDKPQPFYTLSGNGRGEAALDLKSALTLSATAKACAD